MFKFNTKTTIGALTVGLLFLFACQQNEGTSPVISERANVEVFVTTPDQTSLLKKQNEPLLWQSEPKTNANYIDIDERQLGQTVEGFGAALTGSSAYLLHNNPAALAALFGSGGAQLNYTRLTIGASDFNKNGSFTYLDLPLGEEDMELQNFSITEDYSEENPVLPVAKSILQLQPDMQFLATPWSPPAWMKTSKTLNGGSLHPNYFSAYANYLEKYIRAYEREGIPIHTLTVQNEPLHVTSSYPTTYMSAEDQSTFIGAHLGPLFERENIRTKIIAYDHNFTVEDDPDYPLTVLQNTQAKSYISGIAYHAYGGKPEDIRRVTESYPEIDIYFTEQSGIQNEGTTFEWEIRWMMQNVFIGTLREGAKTVLLWNLALDENKGPTNGGCTTCRGVLTISEDGSFTKNVEYYLFAHFTKFLKKGAQRIVTENTSKDLINVAFKNPAGDKILVAYNSNMSPNTLRVKHQDHFFEYEIPGGSLVTFVWD